MSETRRREGYSRKRNRVNVNYNFDLVFITILIVAFGLLMVYSTSSYVAQRDYGDSAKFLKSQGFAAVLGFVGMIAVSKIDYRLSMKEIKAIRMNFVVLLYVLCFFMQAFVLFFGVESHGKKRWINLGFTTFQPSELTKIAVILLVAYVVQRAPRMLDTVVGLIIVIMYNILIIGLIAVANLSTAIIVFMIVIGICFVASRHKGYYFISMLVCFAVVVVYVIVGSQSYRMERVQVWLDIENQPKGYQILQGLYAIASGGILGLGLGQSKQKLGFIPEAHNDMIFTVICEEMGILGAILLIGLFLALLYKIYVVAINAPDLFGSLICVGVLVHIAFQLILNIAVVTNTVPSTGVPLPFVSYGGTSLSILMIEMGLVLSVSNNIKREM